MNHSRAIAGILVLLSVQPLFSQRQSIDIAREPISQLLPGMTSADIAVHGIKLGMLWDEARNALDRKNIPYLFSKTIPITVYVPPAEPAFYFLLNPGSYEVFEMGVMGTVGIPLENRYLANSNHWRLTTARTYFFGTEGHDFLNEEARSFMFERQGFALKYLGNGEFRFVLVYPEGWRPAPPLPPKPAPPVPTPYHTRIPFFVTGYYYPNTVLNYHWLKERVAAGELREAKYIDIKDEDYAGLARQVDAEMENIYSYIHSNLERLAGSDADLVLQAVVTGFVDPRGLTRGLYLDSTISNDVVNIARGSVLEGDEGNRILATLRAYHTKRMIDSYMMEKSALYRSLKEQGRVVWTSMGKGVPKGERALREMRSIEIEIRFLRR